MSTVYVVAENGDLYPIMYSTYELAREAVITKYVDELTAEREEVEEMGDPSCHMVSVVDIGENETGTTQLYIEKGVNVIIQRYIIPCASV